jgi:hypothetical protein
MRNDLRVMLLVGLPPALAASVSFTMKLTPDV